MNRSRSILCGSEKSNKNYAVPAKQVYKILDCDWTQIHSQPLAIMKNGPKFSLINAFPRLPLIALPISSSL